MKREDRKVNKDFLYAMGIIGAENETCDSIETPMDFAYAIQDVQEVCQAYGGRL